MPIGLGFFCSTSDNRLSTNHKIRLMRLNKSNLFDVFMRNMNDFIKLLKLSKEMGLSIFRLGSNIIPFASHPSFDKEWLYEIDKIILDHSELVKSFGIRITMHPGQYVVLNSHSLSVVYRSLREVEYHMRVLDNLKLGPESIIVVHVGGVYGDKERAVKRLYQTLEENRWLLRRIAFENDERFFNINEVIEICESFNIPAVYDHYHHMLNPCSFKVDRLVATWRGIPLEIHVSSRDEASKRFGEHGDYVNLKDFVDAIKMFPEDLNIDVIIEAKKKEVAVLKLIREIRNNYPELMRIVKANYELKDLSF